MCEYYCAIEPDAVTYTHFFFLFICKNNFALFYVLFVCG